MIHCVESGDVMTTTTFQGKISSISISPSHYAPPFNCWKFLHSLPLYPWNIRWQRVNMTQNYECFVNMAAGFREKSSVALWVWSFRTHFAANAKHFLLLSDILTRECQRFQKLLNNSFNIMDFNYKAYKSTLDYSPDYLMVFPILITLSNIYLFRFM